MAVFNYLRKEIDAKIVYYGPAVSGKTTNLQHIHQHLKPEQRGKMVSLATNEDRTLFFDFLPVELDSVRGFKTRFHLYTVPGQAYYGATRRAVLTGSDGVIFVCDSQEDRVEENLYSWKDMEENLRYYGKKIDSIPLVIQFNKRDLPNIFSVEEMNRRFNPLKIPYFESIATAGKGVFETLTTACRLVLKAIEVGVEARRSGGPEAPAETLAPRPSRMVKNIPRPEPPAQPAPSPQPQAQQRKTLRFEKEVPAADSSPQPAVPNKPGGALRFEKEDHAPEPVRPNPGSVPGTTTSPGRGMVAEPVPMAGNTARVRALRLEKGAAVPDVARDVAPPPPAWVITPEKELGSAEPSWSSKVPPEVVSNPEEDHKKLDSRMILSRLFERKKAESSSKVEEHPAEIIPPSREKLKIVACGNPRLLSPSGVEIPLTLEIDGQGKSFSFNLIVNLEQFDKKIG